MFVSGGLLAISFLKKACANSFGVVMFYCQLGELPPQICSPGFLCSSLKAPGSMFWPEDGKDLVAIRLDSGESLLAVMCHHEGDIFPWASNPSADVNSMRWGVFTAAARWYVGRHAVLRRDRNTWPACWTPCGGSGHLSEKADESHPLRNGTNFESLRWGVRDPRTAAYHGPGEDCVGSSMQQSEGSM